MNYLELAAFIFYFIAVLAIGVIIYVKSRDNGSKDYFLGGRKMGPWVTAMSAQASDMSGWLLMGFPGSILAFGFGKMWIGIGLAIGTSLNWIIVARRLRRFSKAAGDAITIPEYLSNRFATTNPALRIICAAVFLVCFTVYVASSFKAGATLFSEVIGIDAFWAMVVFAIIIIAYTFTGGFKAVCWTDFFQGLMMLVAVCAVPIVILATRNIDFSTINNGFAATTAFELNPFKASWQDIVSGLAWGLGYFGMPHILVRFMAIEKPSMVKKSSTVAIIWVIFSLGAAILIGMLGRFIVPELVALGKQENVFISIVRELFPGGLALISGILLSAILAAAMSTADSQLLVASSSFTTDIYKTVVRKKASDKEVLFIGRIIVIIISVVAFLIAAAPGSGTIMSLVENAWAGFGASFGPVIILSLFWRRLTYKGAIAGILGGATTVVLWLIFLSASTGVYELLPGFIVGTLFAIVVSLLDKKPSAEIEDIFNRATNKSVDD